MEDKLVKCPGPKSQSPWGCWDSAGPKSRAFLSPPTVFTQDCPAHPPCKPAPATEHRLGGLSFPPPVPEGPDRAGDRAPWTPSALSPAQGTLLRDPSRVPPLPLKPPVPPELHVDDRENQRTAKAVGRAGTWAWGLEGTGDGPGCGHWPRFLSRVRPAWEAPSDGSCVSAWRPPQMDCGVHARHTAQHSSHVAAAPRGSVA